MASFLIQIMQNFCHKINLFNKNHYQQKLLVNINDKFAGKFLIKKSLQENQIPISICKEFFFNTENEVRID